MNRLVIHLAATVALTAACYDFETASETCRRLGRCPSTDGGDGTPFSDGGPGDSGPGEDGGEGDGGNGDAGSVDGGSDGGVLRETSCTDALDNDNDGLLDCADPDCAGAPCTAGNFCVANTCVPPDGGSGGTRVGASCTSSSECPAPMTCRLTTATGGGTYPGGYCTLVGCSSQSPCPSGSICLGLGAEIGEPQPFCARTCTATAGCRSGYSCRVLVDGFPSVCLPTNLSVDAGPGSNKIGNPCMADTQCTNPPIDGFCLPPVINGNQTGFTDGSCSAYCLSSAHCSSDGGAACFVFPSSTTLSTMCLQLCTGPDTGQSNCRTGYVCSFFGDTTVGYCWPNCNNAPGLCGGATCTANGYCQ